MGLFSPWFLAGLAALGLPLWLHLLRQFKRTPQPFSSLMFFERRVQSSSKHRRLRYLTLLGLRMAVLALLALLFANPFVNRASTSVRKKLTVVAVDRSFSMRFRNRLSDARSQAIQFVNGLPGRQNIRLAALDDQTTFPTPNENDKAAVIDAITSIEATDRASSFGGFSRALRVLEQSSGQSLDVHLFTDAQQTSMPTAFTDLQVGAQTSLTIHAIGHDPSPNWAVQSVNVPARVYETGTVRITAAIGGWQTSDAQRRVSVWLDGHSIASQNASLTGANTTEVEFNNVPVPFGLHRGEVRMEPHDDLPQDDSFFFSVEHADPRKVLFLYSMLNAGSAANAFYYKAALSAAASAGLQVQVQPWEQASGMPLTTYAFVVINNPAELDASSARQLTEYVTKGGSVFIAAGPSTVHTGRIPLTEEGISATSEPQGAGAVESSAQAVFDPAAFANVQFFAAPRVKLAPEDRVFAHFADGSPLLWERKIGEGRILVMAAALDNTSSDFPLHAAFLPFVAATGAYLSGDAGSQPSSQTVGGSVALRQSKSQSASADVTGPDGQHELALSDATRAITFNPQHEGFYDIHRADGRRLLLAVHADRRESNLMQVPRETLILWRNTGKEAIAQETESAAITPFSLWRYILTLLLMAAVVESVFATRYLSEERQVT